MTKRFLDIAGATIGLLLLSPLMLIVAAAVKLESRGSALFVQTRVGRRQVPFKLYKFRTMLDHRRDVLLIAGKEAYVTRVGRFLRRHKIDELPQLFNVLKGDMSLVGPRPEVPKYVDCYPARLKERIFSVRPGMTDAASLEFMNESELLAGAEDAEELYVRVILPRKLALSCRCLADGSPLSDLRIVARTVTGLFR